MSISSTADIIQAFLVIKQSKILPNSVAGAVSTAGVAPLPEDGPVIVNVSKSNLS